MASALRWAGFKLLTFDCYGTLIDWEAGILAVLRPWAERSGLRASDDELLAAFGKAESAAEREAPYAVYRDILRGTMSRIATQFGKAARASEQDALALSVGDWPAFADTAESLHALHEWHKLMVVSNVDKASFARTAPKLGVRLDGLVTAEEVGAYKPDERMFRRALEVAAGWGIGPQEILHVAQSLYHDIVPAKRLGLATVWVDRRVGRPGGAAPMAPGHVVPDLRVTSLRELVEVERRERRC
jgi:2-haloacid dehalogenase